MTMNLDPESAGPSALMHKHVASFAREICMLGVNTLEKAFLNYKKYFSKEK